MRSLAISRPGRRLPGRGLAAGQPAGDGRAGPGRRAAAPWSRRPIRWSSWPPPTGSPTGTRPRGLP